jgi:hypothetical protein
MTDAIRTQMLKDKAACEEEVGEHEVAGRKRTQKERRREERRIQVVEEDDDSVL